MSGNCEEFSRQEREARRLYTQIADPQIGDVIHPRTGDTGIKVLVCPARSVIACLSTGDQVCIANVPKWFRQQWALPHRPLVATFSMINGERFIFEDGKQVPLSKMVGRVLMTVINVASIRHADHYSSRPRARKLRRLPNFIPPAYQTPQAVATGVGAAMALSAFVAFLLMR